jgi:hypothetical protein
VIQLSDGEATAAIGGVALVVAAWAGWYSVGSATRGPAWALAHLRTAVPVFGWALLPMLVAALLIRPVWAGVGALYVLGMARWLVGSQRRSLLLVEREIGFEAIDPIARRRTLRRARIAAGVGAVVLAALGVIDLVVRGWPGLFALSLGVVLAVASLRLGRTL